MFFTKRKAIILIIICSIFFILTYKDVKSELIFETPNYKVRIGEYKDINVASQSLEKIRRIYPGSFIIKLSDL